MNTALSPSYELRPCLEGEEDALVAAALQLLPHFNLEFWQWKFARAPFGEACMINAWAGETLLVHSSAYRLSVWLKDSYAMAYQVNCEFSPDLADKDLLIATMQQLERAYFQKYPLAFLYSIQTAAKLPLFQQLGYDTVFTLQPWHLPWSQQQQLIEESPWRDRFAGYSVNITRHVGRWAEIVFEQAKSHYGALIARTAQYLRWRYENHPTHDYQFVVVSRLGKPLGWWLVKIEENQVQISDALFTENADIAARIGLKSLCKWLYQQTQSIHMISAGFSPQPNSWVELLMQLGFVQFPQSEATYVCLKPYAQTLTAGTLAQQFYVSAGENAGNGIC